MDVFVLTGTTQGYGTPTIFSIWGTYASAYTEFVKERDTYMDDHIWPTKPRIEKHSCFPIHWQWEGRLNKEPSYVFSITRWEVG